MIIKEYQVKKIFKKNGIPILKGGVAYTPEEAKKVASKIGGNAWVIKAQVSDEKRSRSYFLDTGENGLSGICWANTLQMVAGLSEQMLGHRLITPKNPSGVEVRRVYVEEACLGQAEYKLSLHLDFMTQCLILDVYSAGNVLRQYELSGYKLTDSDIKRIVGHMNLKSERAKEMRYLLKQMMELFSKYQAIAVEFDPVWETINGFIVLDGRIIFDKDVLFRYPEIAELSEIETGQERHEIARKNNFRYTKLNGNIACLVNGIGLSQATLDLIHDNGGQVACLLDVGTEPSRDSVTKALKLALADPDVDGVLVNIFGGITRCDIIVQGLFSAAGEVLAGLPVVIRMDGTNANIGRRLLFESRLPFTVATKIDEAVKEIIRQVKEAF
jgi:succinyl-CoA synthetase beta subunit